MTDANAIVARLRERTVRHHTSTSVFSMTSDRPDALCHDAADYIEKLEAERAAALKEEDETYRIGVRDGYERATQKIDIETGGDGEYRYCMGQKDWPETHCPDAGSMQIRIQMRFQATIARAEAAEAERDSMKAALTALARIIENNITENDAPNRLHWRGHVIEGVAADAVYSTLKSAQSLAKAALGDSISEDR
jgi:hypothetical protein